MPEELKYTVFNTRMGWVGLLASEDGLLAVTFPRRTANVACKMLGSRVDNAAPAQGCFTATAERLRAYFDGERVEFHEKLDLSGATPFRRVVWIATGQIPYGETRSYQWVARQIGKPEAARAVGQALGSNPLPVIVPCHRVVASDGALGGFTGGLPMKRRLLRLESALDKIT